MNSRMESLLERADWVLNRGTNWKEKQKTKFSLTCIYPFWQKTLLHVAADVMAEFILAEVLFEEGRLH